MRPSKLKTPLAKLRAMLKVQTGTKTIKRKSATIPTYGHLSRQQVADWLGCTDHNISSIESGRVKLTVENAEIIMRQTGVSKQWLLGKNATSYPITLTGRRYTQQDFEETQKNLNSPTYPALRAQQEFRASVAMVATVLMRACERGEIETYSSKVRNALCEIFAGFPKNQQFINFGDYIDETVTTLGVPDFNHLLKEWSFQLDQVVGKAVSRHSKR